MFFPYKPIAQNATFTKTGLQNTQIQTTAKRRIHVPNLTKNSHMKKNEIISKPLLTPCQENILNLIAAGNSSKQIAGILNISEHTVGNHRSNILKKLNAKNTVEAFTIYTRHKKEK